MARSLLASLASCACLLGALPATGGAASASFRHRARCASARSAGATSGTRSFRKASCPSRKGSPRYSGRPAGLLYFTAQDGRCRDAALAPSAYDLPQVRAATLCLVNRERAARGEAPLHWNLSLVRCAQSHTESMAFGGYFAHIGRSGETPLERMRRSGYIHGADVSFEVGENIAWGSLWLGTPRAIVAAWMASPGHRANILDARFRDTGIGVSPHLGSLAGGQSGGIYTQDFGVIDG